MKKKNYKSRKRVISLLLLVSLILTTGTFAYWASYVEGTQSDVTETLTIGYANGVETIFEITNELNSGGYLVPTNQVLNSIYGAVNEIDLSYNIAWDEDSDTTQLIGTSTTGKISISHNVVIVLDGKELDSTVYPEIYNLIDVAYNSNNATHLILDNDPEAFLFTISMDEPEDQREYDLIKDAVITVVFSFTMYDNFIETTDTLNTVTIEAPAQTGPVVETGNGDDFLIIEEEIEAYTTIDMGMGHDVLMIDATINEGTSIIMGDGYDTVIIIDSLTGDITMNTGNDDDSVSVNNNVSEGASIDTGSGNDELTIAESLSNATVATGSGDDYLSINILNDNATITTGEDNDSITISTVTNDYVGHLTLDEGNDTLTIYDDTSVDQDLQGTVGTFDGGAGQDTLNLESVTIAQWNSYVSELFTNFETIVLSDGTLNL